MKPREHVATSGVQRTAQSPGLVASQTSSADFDRRMPSEVDAHPGRRQQRKHRVGEVDGAAGNDYHTVRWRPVGPVEDVDDFHEQRHPAAAEVEGALGADVEPRVIGQPYVVARAAREQAAPPLFEVAGNREVAAESQLRAETRLRRESKVPVSGERVPLIEIAPEGPPAPR